MLAIGQIGWFAIIVQIGGESLGILTAQPVSLGIVVYAVLMWVMASLKLHLFGLVKGMIVVSSVLLMLYLGWSYSELSPQSGALWAGENLWDLFWGISVVVVSLVSFISVSPDFFHQVQHSRDVLKSIRYGILLPGILIVSFGAFLFFGYAGTPSISVLIAGTSVAAFGDLINVLTNTDAAVAAYTPGFRFSYMFGVSLRSGILAACTIGSILALLDISAYLELWLGTLAGIYPAVIGVCLAHYTLVPYGVKLKQYPQIRWRVILIVISCSLLIFIINLALLHWVVGLTSFILYALVMGVKVKLYIEDNIN